MGVFQSLSVVALRQLVNGACSAVGISGGGDKVVDFLTTHFKDHSQKLTTALQTANERAWKALEIALGGESLWERIKGGLAKAEDKAFREQVRAFLDISPLTKTSSKYPEVFQRAREELRAARSEGSLMGGRLAADELARQAGAFARFSDPQAQIDAEWKAIELAANNLRESCPNLFRILVARTTSGEKPSILAVAVRYYFRREVEKDDELARGLFFAKFEILQEAQEKGFAALYLAITQRGQRLEELLVTVIEAIQRLEQKIEKLLDQLQMRDREVRPSDSMSVRSEGERDLVKQLVETYRASPEEERKKLPGMLISVGKLGMVAGDFKAAQDDFVMVAEMVDTPQAKAEAHHNAYEAALQRQEWAGALASMQQAVTLDPTRFAPFPLDRYEPTRILGAGGFGVAFLCHHKFMRDNVVVKTLQSDELDCNVDRVFAEAQALRHLDHPSIIRLSDCGYVDAGGKSRPYLAMDYFDGVNLESYVAEEGLLSPEDLLAVAFPVAEALQAAHARGILHRDVKPANVLVRRDDRGWRVKLIDFGLALRPTTFEGKGSTPGPQAQTTMGKTIAGTMHYAAPEQMGASLAPVGPYSDVYGFGRSCYFALLGTPEPDDEEKESLPESWRELLSRCTRRKVANRFPDFTAVLAGLATLRGPGPVVPPPPEPPVKPPEPPVREPETPTVRETSEPPASLLYLKSKGIVAMGYEVPDGFMVLAGSQAVKGTAPSIPANLAELRNSLTQKGDLVQDRGALTLNKDCVFDSPSSAACVILGRSANGRLQWKDEQGRSLKELQDAANADPTGGESSPPADPVVPTLETEPAQTNSLGMGFAWIPPGRFLMGSPRGEEGRDVDETQHWVTLTKGFYLGVHLVTQAQWQWVMGTNPSHFKGDNRPVDTVSWDDCQEFCQKLSQLDGKPYRLPTEAEWEYACRAGTNTAFSFGETISSKQANCSGYFTSGRGKSGYRSDRSETSPVGSFPANAWGLYDMHGNVWEWCADWYGPYPTGDVEDPKGPDNGSARVLRGGSWCNNLGSCRSANRENCAPGYRSQYGGCRVCFGQVVPPVNPLPFVPQQLPQQDPVAVCEQPVSEPTDSTKYDGLSVPFEGVNVTRERILNAMREFDIRYPESNHYDSWLEKGTYRYAVRHKGKLYPCKYILSLVVGIETQNFYGGNQANNVFWQLGFEVIKKPSGKGG